ncbi:DUF5829 family protein [Allokutzneria sp. A3M-2-11 16]|uniref:DUF5829 family protein n=1 Tax=Allokutzneria sp. A3M-2-11 16 TaxID=2962043 RepID=UPI0020B81F5F|nr:DUF5829 family protein [Allokutzneria sp. A3M-2-11 16]MCP3803158.1 DUF5829 family protein [Allokutzneria sp. A3M-2-11 16]
MLIRRMSRMFVAVAVALAVSLLGSLTSTAAEAFPGRQLLFYNHAYGVFDRETADAVEHSAYLRTFANFQVRTTTGAGGSKWTGRYLMGRETYLEVFGVGDLPGQDGTIGRAGLAVSAERAGDLPTVLNRLRDQGITDPVVFRQTRDFGDGVPMPWFDGVFTSAQYDAFGAWGMEYRPEYFADPRSKTEPAAFPGDVGRERYLSDDYAKHLMRDVTGVRIAITERDLANTVPLLRAGGFVPHPVAGGGIVAQRGGTTIRLEVAAREEVGLRQVEMSLNRAVAHRHEERLGRSTLVVGPGPRAVWAFDPRR